MIEGALRKGKRVIFCVPALSLIDQTYSSFFNQGVYDVGVLQGNHPQTNLKAPVQIASVQTLCSRKIPAADLVIVDEAHRWFDFMGKWMSEWSTVPFIGLSASPWARGLGRFYDDLLVGATTQELIDGGFLSPFRAFAPTSSTLTTGIDWNVGCLSLCRPTKSEMLFTQIIGRALRTAPGKEYALILDHSDTTRRLGFVTDIYHDRLDGGEMQRTKGSRREKEKAEKPKPEECLNCGRIKPAAARKCPSCGFMSAPRTKHVHADGELAQVCGKTIKADRQTKQGWYSGLLHIANERGFKNGWAANQYRARFDVWPRGLDELRTPPSTEIKNWVLSRQIAYSKSRKRAA
jgi:superfamily II DNA or RNA helicase